MNRHEESLLLYLETCVVDHGGEVEGSHMNKEEYGIAHRWHETGFIAFGRLPAKSIMREGKRGSSTSRRATNWVRFSGAAWAEAHRLRRERAERLIPQYEERRGYTAQPPATPSPNQRADTPEAES